MYRAILNPNTDNHINIGSIVPNYDTTIVIVSQQTFSILKKPLSKFVTIVIGDSTCNKPTFIDTLCHYVEHISGKGEVIHCGSVMLCLEELNKTCYKKYDKLWIGEEYMDMWKMCEDVYIFDDIIEHYKDFLRNHVELCFERCSVVYRRFKRCDRREESFIELLRDVKTYGDYRTNRTGINTYSIFGRELTFDLSRSFPLLTTRKMNLRPIFEELMFFIRGQSDNSILVNKNVHIWTPNTTREFLDSRGLHQFSVGDIGASYGFQMRHFGAEYVNCKTNYEGQGYDQLMNAIDLIKNDPTSRRIIINLWNPTALDKMSLPPCLYCYQFYVCDGMLSCKITQRSSDIALAGGWNIASCAMLTHMLARVTGLKVGKLIWSAGDIHIYEDQMGAVDVQLDRLPRYFPHLFFKDTAPKDDITKFEYDDLLLVNYNPHTAIKFPAMSV